ncbi:MAG: ABC transporter ATP-binding protein [Bacteroidales bacterium]|nr:ABC transporter ATP-binding protein [Bacteroidales bacterium]
MDWQIFISTAPTIFKNMQHSALSFSHLSTGYSVRHDKIEIGKDLSASLPVGQFTCLLGPNGAGKSTLFRTLAGFIPSLSGIVTLMGRPVQQYKAEELAKTISVVLTERPSVTAMTVVQLVSLGRSPYTGFWGRLTDVDRHRAEEAMVLARCVELKDRLVDTLSDGECQRVMIAKALAQDTPVIFLDEPTAFLDFPSKVEMMRTLKRLAHEAGKSILLSTHDVNMALQTADNLWLLDRKFGLSCGSLESLAREETLQKYFLRDGIAFDDASSSFIIV